MSIQPNREISRRELLAAASAATVVGCATLRRTPAPARSVLVVGAGIAGLSAAYELLKQGFDVRVIEAQAAAGGRIRTVRSPFPEGLHVEAGATHVVGDPDLLSLLSELKIELTRPARKRWPHRVVYRGGVRRVVKSEEPWKDEAPPLRPDEESLDFKRLLEKYFGSPSAIDPRTTDWSRPELASLDKQTAEAFLIARGASEGYRRLAETTFCPTGDLKTMSGLGLMREALNFQQEIDWDDQRIVGGADVLPKTLASHLGERVLFGARALRIEQRASTATVTFAKNGETHQLTAAHVVCAIPGRVIRALELSPALPPDTVQALDALNAVSVVRVYAAARTRFWNQRGESGRAESDLPIGEILDEASDQVSSAGILGVSASAENARRLAALSEEERHREVVDGLNLVHPGLREQLLATHSVCWDNEELFRGAYTWLGPEQLSRQQPLLRRPHGVIHFAGEYNSHRPGFMHGALSSAKRVVAEILEAGKRPLAANP